MSNSYSRKMFVNLAVKDLGRSMGFFRGLGFQFDPKFTNDKGACMIISDQAYVMLLSEPFFKTFTKKKICETASHTEGLFALSCDGCGREACHGSTGPRFHVWPELLRSRWASLGGPLDGSERNASRVTRANGRRGHDGQSKVQI